MQEFELKVDKLDAGMRLDLYLLKFAEENDLGISRSFLQRLILSQAVTSSGLTPKAHYKIKAGEAFKVCIPDKKPLALEAEDIPLNVVY